MILYHLCNLVASAADPIKISVVINLVYFFKKETDSQLLVNMSVSLIQSIIIVKILKRLFYRKRPWYCMAFKGIYYFDSPPETTSSLFSQTLIVSSSIVYSMTLNYLWYQRLLFTISAFIFSSYFKIHAGSIYPSDALMTIPPVLLNIFCLFLHEYFSYFGVNREDISCTKEKVICIMIICTVMVLMSKRFQLIVKTPFWLCVSFSLIIQKDYLIDELSVEHKMMQKYIIMVQFTNFFIAKGVGETLVGRRMGSFQSMVLRAVISGVLLIINISTLLIVNRYQ